MWIYWRLFLIAVRLTGRRRQDLVLENLVLRQPLAVWGANGAAPTVGKSGSALLVDNRAALARVAGASSVGPARHRGWLAPDGMAAPLALGRAAAAPRVGRASTR